MDENSDAKENIRPLRNQELDVISGGGFLSWLDRAWPGYCWPTDPDGLITFC
jgi:hypothetical protein